MTYTPQEKTNITALTEDSLSKKKRNSFHRRFLRQWDLQLMLLPALIALLIFSYGPMWGISLSFLDYSIYKGLGDAPWVGFKHFQMLFHAIEFPKVMYNTIALSLLKFAVGFPVPILLAVMLNEVRSNRFKRSVQTITYMPNFISWVVAAGFVFTLLSRDGLVNAILVGLHILEQPVDYMLQPQYFWTILILTGIWKGAGFGAIIYLAAISNIDPTLYEAADIDGAGRFRKIFAITLPSIQGVVIILLILSIGNILNAGFDDIFLLTNNMRNYSLTDVANTIDIYVFREGIMNRRYSYGTAAGLFKGIANAILLTTANFAAGRMGRSTLW